MSLQHKFSYTDESNAPARLKSLEGGPGGPMSVSKDQIIAVSLGDDLPSLTATTRKLDIQAKKGKNGA